MQSQIDAGQVGLMISFFYLNLGYAMLPCQFARRHRRSTIPGANQSAWGTDFVADYDQLIHGLKTPSGRVDLQLRCLCPFPRLARALCGSFNLCVTQKFEA